MVIVYCWLNNKKTFPVVEYIKKNRIFLRRICKILLHKMKIFPILFFFSLLVVNAFCAEDKYTTKYDNIDIDEILRSDRLLKNYINCILNRGRCTSDGAELKSKQLFLFFLKSLFFVYLRTYC